MVLKNERGGVTAEFAVALPTLLMIVAIIIGAITIVTQKLTLVSAVHDIARLEARGDIQLADARLKQLGMQVNIERRIDSQILCVTATQTPATKVLSVLEIKARGCAAVATDYSVGNQ